MSEDLSGQSLGSFRIERLLGRGGMGAVYLGVEPATGRRVALKVMLRQLGENPEFAIRFEREARVAGQVDHANVARVLESGAAADVRYLAMEFIDGEPLSQMLKGNRPLSPRRALDYACQAARGLEAALRTGSIHRDIKPENLMLTRDGIVKIVDFGLAKNESVDSFKTATGVIMGTPHYISPEQALGRAVDHRTDIYSLGASLYHMLAGRPPFTAETAFEIVQKHIKDEPKAITAWNADVPEHVCQIAYRMMKKHPDERYQTYGHLISTLEDAIAGRSAPKFTMDVVGSDAEAQASPGWLTPRMKLIMGGTAVALILLGLTLKALFAPAPLKEGQTEFRGIDQEAIGVFGNQTRETLRGETLPALDQIGREIRELDREEREFSSPSRRRRD